MVDDVELGRRLAALRNYRGMGQRDVAERARELGLRRGLGATQISLIEQARAPQGIDTRVVMLLAEIYGVDFKVLIDENTQIFAAKSTGLVEGLIARVDALTLQIERVSAQVAAQRVRETAPSKQQRDPLEASQSTQQDHGRRRGGKAAPGPS